MKKKIIIALTIIVIIMALCWLPSLEEKALEMPPMDNTIYVQSNSPGECRAIITPILDGKKSTPSELPCKVQRRLTK